MGSMRMCRKSRISAGFSVLCCSVVLCAIGAAEGPPQLLPDASDFRLTLAEDPHSSLPAGASCTGEAGLTLTCRAFLLTLENASKNDTIRISWANCVGPLIRIDRKEPQSSSGWWPVSQVQGKACSPPAWSNLRLKPGEKTNYATRLIAPDRYADAIAPGSYTLRAEWLLFGCTEGPDGKDCLAPLHAADKPNAPSAFDWQDPVGVISNEVTVQSPSLPDLGTPRFTISVMVRPGPPRNDLRKGLSANCTGENSASLDCVVFHYTIRNVTGRAVRNGTLSCSDRPITWEYRTEDGKWAAPAWRMDAPMVCNSNVYIETRFFPTEPLKVSSRLQAVFPNTI